MTSRLPSLRAVLKSAHRLEVVERRLAKTETRLKRQNERITSQGERLKRYDERLRGQKQRLDQATRMATRTHSLFEIIRSQVAGIEERLQNLTERVERAQYDATDQEQAQARSLLEEIRDEHRRIRVRFGVVARYEERLRRLESALAEEMVAAAALAREAAMNGMVAGASSDGAVDIPDESADRAP
jgi:chromosome segregation ATPase